MAQNGPPPPPPKKGTEEQTTSPKKLAEQDPERTQILFKLIDKNTKNWKRGSSGLNASLHQLSHPSPRASGS